MRQEFQKLWRELRRVAKATLQNGSIGRAGIRVYDGGRIRIEGGGGIDIVGSGYIRIDGDLTGDGELSWTGPWELLGNGEVTGTVTWSGDLNLTGDITVLGSGRIIAGNITIDPSAAGGRIGFGSDRFMHAGSGFLGVYDGSRFVVFNSSGVAIHGGAGSPTLSVGPGGVRISGLSKVPKAGVPANCVYVGSDGFLHEG
ncbi:hypothetical protein [Microbacterium sp.]|uniref:hypothetical protein n=1 Tax=Microbacterium sp. TaxID=51671 RepID=UPI0028111A6B|nr:hypothetical protein [Microbacterium sp.]